MGEYFKDRVVEHPARVTLTGVGSSSFAQADIQDEVLNLSDTASVIADMTRTEGTITEAGTPLNASNLNGIITEMISDMITNNIQSFLLHTGASGDMFMPTSKYVIVFWRISGSNYGIDFVYPSSNAPSYTSLVLAGTHYVTYTYGWQGDDRWMWANNTSESDMRLVMIGSIGIEGSAG